MTQQNIAYSCNIIDMSTSTHALLLVVPRPSLPPRRPTLPKPSLPRPTLLRPSLPTPDELTASVLPSVSHTARAARSGCSSVAQLITGRALFTVQSSSTSTLNGIRCHVAVNTAPRASRQRTRGVRRLAVNDDNCFVVVNCRHFGVVLNRPRGACYTLWCRCGVARRQNVDVAAKFSTCKGGNCGR